MTNIHLTLNNCFDFKSLLEILPKDDTYEFTSKKIFRLKERRICNCGTKMMHNSSQKLLSQ